jgi:uncharacterized protein YecE (DUF72 family)
VTGSGRCGERLHVGTSGWSYPHWRQGFYAGIPQRRWLAHCAGHFTAVEVNATFYRRMKPETLGRWHDETPEAFAFAVKGHRFITHIRRLAEVEELLARERAGLAPLGDKLAAVLWELPPSLTKDLRLLRDFAGLLAGWAETRHVIEFRHRSWFNDAVLSVLADHRLGTCISDAPRWPMWDAVASDLAYCRLHGHRRLYASAYGTRALKRWSERVVGWIEAGCEVHVYFDNDAEGAAPTDAVALLSMVRDETGREPS